MLLRSVSPLQFPRPNLRHLISSRASHPPLCQLFRRTASRPINPCPVRGDRLLNRRCLSTIGTFPIPSHANTASTRPSYTFSPLSDPLPSTSTLASDVPRFLPRWLLGCSALVLGILVLGGVTRLTESGLSITEWEPFTGILPPVNDEQWAVEWEKYRRSPEGVLMNSKIEMSQFKRIFYMEWGHRVAGRLLGVVFVVPAIYYTARYRLPRILSLKLLGLSAGIGMQGVIGWYMVKSGLEQEIIDTKGVPRVSQYRLAAHLSAALALYVGMLHTSFGLIRDMATSQLAASRVRELARTMDALPINRYRSLVRVVGGMVFFTAISGAFVAGLDAGLVYNEFPTMGGRLVPPASELMDERYAKRPDHADTWWRNMLENPVTAQFDHRVFATTTFTALLSLPLIARVPSLRIPLAARRFAGLTAAAAVAQVTLGITTLLYLVPVPLAAMHQAGSVVLLTCLTGLAVTLRRPGAALSLRTRMRVH